MRWIILIAALVGTATGLAWPSGTQGGTTGKLFDAWYNIPSGSSGQGPAFLQNWHGGYCPPSGNACALDWGATDAARRIEFRGGFKRTSPSGITAHTHQYTVKPPGDPIYCDEFAVDVHEDHLEFIHGDHTPRWGVHYFHGHLKSGLPNQFWINTVPTGWGAYNSFHVGTIMNTSDHSPPTCFWSGVNVHDEVWVGPCPQGLPGYEYRLGFFQVGQPYQNNAHWTRHMQWGEGGYQSSC
jgi:hypothetical protein